MTIEECCYERRRKERMQGFIGYLRPTLRQKFRVAKATRFLGG